MNWEKTRLQKGAVSLQRNHVIRIFRSAEMLNWFWGTEKNAGVRPEDPGVVASSGNLIQARSQPKTAAFHLANAKSLHELKNYQQALGELSSDCFKSDELDVDFYELRGSHNNLLFSIPGSCLYHLCQYSDALSDFSHILSDMLLPNSQF